MLPSMRSGLVMGLALASVAGCASRERTELTEARARWAEVGQRYRFDLTKQCDCGNRNRLTRITVADAQVLDAYFVDDGTYIDEASRPHVDTIESILVRLDEALDSADAVDATYDPALGHPITVHIVYDERMDSFWYADVSDVALL